MKKNELTYGRAIGFGVVSELVLIAIQYLLLTLYHSANPATPFSFSTEYMMSRGFYVFLIPGFIVFAVVVFFILTKYTLSSVVYLFVFLLAAAIIEVAFYLTIPAHYQGAFVYSILDKVIGSALGVIGFFSVGTGAEVSKNA